MPPRWGNRGYRSSSKPSGRSPGTGRQQRQRAQRSRSRGAQRGVSGKTTYVTPKVTSNKKNIQQNIKTQQDKNKGLLSWFDKNIPGKEEQKRNTGVIRDVKAEQEAGEADFLDSNVKGIPWLTHKQLQDNRSKIAYQESQKNQQQVQDALDLADKYRDNKGNINVNNISDEDLKKMRDAKLFAMESSGELGGTFGLEVEVNKLKQQLAETGDTTALERLGYDPGVINQMDPYMEDPNNPGQYIPNPNYNPSLGFDPTGTKTGDDVESDPNLKWAYYGLQNLKASPDQLRQHLPSLTGYSAPKVIGGGVGGWGSGYTQSGYGGGGGGHGYGMQTEDPMAQGYQRGKVGPGSLQEQVNQLYLGSANIPGFNKNRGGIISLLGLD